MLKNAFAANKLKSRCKTALKKDGEIIFLRHLSLFVKIKILRILYFFSLQEYN